MRTETMRNTYIIIPLKTTGEINLKTYSIKNSEELGFDSESMSDLIRHKCSKDQGFVRRFRLQWEAISVNFADGFSVPVKDIQLTAFENGIGFLSVLFCVKESDIKRIYNFVNPGYLTGKDEDLQQIFINDIRQKVLSGTGFDIYVEGENKALAIKESYLFNAAFVDYRFDELPELEQATFNVHKILGVDENIVDESEADIAYTFGGRDVENRTYRWGCCISSQSISFVYGPGNSNYNAEAKTAIRPASDFSIEEMINAAEDDILLTLLALYQRFTCMMLAETIQRRMRKEGGGQKAIRELKSEVMRFRAYDTLTPFQISRWNNVCETYRYLLEMNGVQEALDNVAENIDLINEEMERIESRRESYFTTIIAVFGLTSIVASVQQITDYILQGESTVMLWTKISFVGLAALGVAYIIMNRRKK